MYALLNCVYFLKNIAEDFSKLHFLHRRWFFEGFFQQGKRRSGLALHRLVEFVQNHARNGWNEEDAQTFHEMALRYAVLLEERRGPTACVIIVHNLLHFKDDIKRFSGLDNYSCWTKERAVRTRTKFLPRSRRDCRDLAEITEIPPR